MKNCIFECVNRQHECPECRAKLAQTDLFRNYALETLLQRLQEERDREQQHYFNDLAGNGAPAQDRSPIETVFTLNLRESLLAYQEYLESLTKEKEALQTKVKQGLSQQLLQARQEGNALELERVERELASAMRELDQKFSGAVDQLVMSYDEHMKQIMPKPKLLPIRVSLTIEAKPGFRIDNAHIKPYDNANDLFKLVEDFQAARGDPVLSWSKPAIRVLLTGPLHQP